MQKRNQKTGLYGVDGVKAIITNQKKPSELPKHDTTQLEDVSNEVGTVSKAGRLKSNNVNKPVRTQADNQEYYQESTKSLIDFIAFKNRISKLSSWKKYYQLTSNISMVVDRKYNFFLCEAEHGAGKTTLAKSILDHKGKIQDVDYAYHNGPISPLALYKLLDENKDGKVIILDDVVNYIKDENTIEILKAATDDKRVRVVQYRTTKGKIESSFKFTSSIIIFINNPLSKKHAALKDRGFYQVLKLTTNERLEYIKEFLMDAKLEFAQEATSQQRLYVFDRLREMVNSGHTDFTCRTYIQLLIRFIEDEKLFEAIISEHSKPTDESRLRMIMHKYQGQKRDWPKLFMEETGKSERTYQTTLKKIKEDMDLQTYKSLANNNELLRKEIKNGSKN